MTPNSMQTSDASMDTSRQRFADRATEKFRDLGFGMKDLANRGVHTVTDSAREAQRHLGQYASATGRYVTEQPLKSALIAAAIGAAVAGLIIALRHRHHD